MLRSYVSYGLAVMVEFVGGVLPVYIGAVSGHRCCGSVVVGMVVGEIAGEDTAEKVWTKVVRYGGGLSGMRAGKYGMGNTRDGLGWRVAGDAAILVRAEGRECVDENEGESS